MDRVINIYFADEQSFLAHRKSAIELLYLDRCGTIEGIWLLGLHYFDSSWWTTLGFVFRRFSVAFALSAQTSWCATICTKTDGLLRLSIAYSSNSSARGLSSLPNVFICNNASAARSFLPARCTTPKLNLKILSLRRASRLLESVRITIFLKVSLSVCIVK